MYSVVSEVNLSPLCWILFGGTLDEVIFEIRLLTRIHEMILFRWICLAILDVIDAINWYHIHS